MSAVWLAFVLFDMSSLSFFHFFSLLLSLMSLIFTLFYYILRRFFCIVLFFLLMIPSFKFFSIFLLLSLFHPHCVSLLFFFFFSLTGDIFLLNTNRLPDRCEFSLHSPILPGSLESCLLELAIYSQDAVPLLQRFTVEIRYVETNRNIIISLRVVREEDAG